MKKILVIAGVLTVLLSACLKEKVLPELNEMYSTKGVNNYFGVVESIEDNLVMFDDGKTMKITGNTLASGLFITMIVTEGSTEYEFAIKEIVFHSTVLAHSPGNELAVNLVDGEAKVSGNYVVVEGNIISIKDKRFVLTDETKFLTTNDDEEYVISDILNGIEQGTILTGFGIETESVIDRGTLSIIYAEE